ncbi:molybdopterin-guanine dinucleotide biosynthesis protein B [Ideonella alba]|uniref:Molybdopterin-guanine dinucleotide biosynthesis protein B n=1 Tax=Ideonella alba TaxID=2824118 RepID=A0A940Y9D9_9BURK|nr:molybdopterin-guanine dinucleotide biosynthesis protein B [Ideonella alba]MBQ0931288.1 molybdopterin-guanine dinucleotide biosynthesis protein B [Ideonella alba]
MKVIGLAGYSGSGKTTLIEQLIAGLKAAGQRVSVVKHAHKDSFDIDHPGKDSWRHRQAGALEVVVANARRMALIREFPQPVEIEPHALLAELAPCDWALVEGFKHGDLPKIEVWRAALGRPAMYPNDPFIVGIATDDPAALPEPTGLPVFRLDAPEALLAHLLASGERYQYTQGHHG